MSKRNITIISILWLIFLIVTGIGVARANGVLSVADLDNNATATLNSVPRLDDSVVSQDVTPVRVGLRADLVVKVGALRVDDGLSGASEALLLV